MNNDLLFKLAENEDIRAVLDERNYAIRGEDWVRLLIATIVKAHRDATVPPMEEVARAVTIAIRDSEPQDAVTLGNTAVAVIYNHLGLPTTWKGDESRAARIMRGRAIRNFNSANDEEIGR